MINTKPLTILHSNDMHGDFMAEELDNKLVGGVSLLSGYIQRARREDPNVIYAVSGDMFRGSLIDSEYKGISTIEIMNMIAPDVVTIGNHEVDYGLAHLLFIEKCATFPIINANMFITSNHRRLFKSHHVIQIDGMNILFIGILTQDTIKAIKPDPLIGSFVDIAEAAAEVGRICNARRTEDMDLTVLLTHIGFEADKELAAALDPEWGVDVIIGGHTHTRLDEPAVVNGIYIVQAVMGTDQIGRFDIIVDTDNNCVHEWKWGLVPINEDTCPWDHELEEVIRSYKEETDTKYGRIVTRFADVYTHPARNQETQLGRLFADAFKDITKVDIMFVGSGSIRGEALGTIVTREDLRTIFPYNDAIYRVMVKGSTLKKMVKHIYRDAAWLPGGHTEFYQFSRGFRAEYNKKTKELVSLSLNGYEISDDDEFALGLQEYHYNNIEGSFNLTREEVEAIDRPKKISTNSTDVIDEYFSDKELVRVSEETRMVFIE
ncbi:MAG: bifunctional metallophosphatase/5'-nucleotidase [Clostridiales bacterium]|nr:bifunctional metallophosphatase/5'-nucleotidase [Clostridiales bacterium]